MWVHASARSGQKHASSIKPQTGPCCCAHLGGAGGLGGCRGQGAEVDLGWGNTMAGP